VSDDPLPAGAIEAGLFPLPDAVLLPGTVLRLHVFEPRYRRLVADTLDSLGYIAVPRLEPGYEADYYGCPAIRPVMGVGRIVEHERLEDGRFNIALLGVARMQLSRELRAEPYRVAEGRVLCDKDAGPVAATLHAELTKLLVALRPFWSDAGKELERATLDTPGLGACTDVLSQLFQSADDRQRLLEELDPAERAMLLCARLHELWEQVEQLGPGVRRARPN
jgi:Lon protease-like protein